jgi:hypothetical protein
VIYGSAGKKKTDEEKAPFVDTQLQAALGYLRGQLRASQR